jgi:shikimate kinase
MCKSLLFWIALSNPSLIKQTYSASFIYEKISNQMPTLRQSDDMVQIQEAKSNIALIGYRWTGKTTVGLLLADALRMDFVDTDALIEANAKKPTARIFTEDGESAFRLHEISAVMDASHMSRAVISTGGGVVLNKVNTDMLRDTSHVVLLTADTQTMVERAEADTQHIRPALTGLSPTEEIEEVMKLRRPLYDAYSDFAVDTSKLSIQSVVDEIISRLGLGS